MADRNKTIVAVDSDFFKNVFEPGRKKYEKQLGIRLSQPKFTKMLLKNGFKMDMPKLDKKFKGVNKNQKAFTI